MTRVAGVWVAASIMMLSMIQLGLDARAERWTSPSLVPTSGPGAELEGRTFFLVDAAHASELGETLATSQTARIVDEYGGFTLVEGEPADYESVSSAGLAPSVIGMVDGVLLGGRWLPSASVSKLLPEDFSEGKKSIAVVSFVAPVRDDWLNAVTSWSGGAIVVSPPSAVIACLDRAAARSVLSLPFVEWLGVYPPDLKVDPDLRIHAQESDISVEIRTLCADDPVFLSNWAEQLGVLVQSFAYRGDGEALIFGRASWGSISRVAQDAGTLWVAFDRDSGGLLDEVAAEIVGGAFSGDGTWANSLGYDGTGVRVAVIDSGIDDGTQGMHADFQNRVVATVDYTGGHGEDRQDHGTPVAGVVAGNGALGTGRRDGNGYLWGNGAAPAAQLLNVRNTVTGASFANTNWADVTTWIVNNGGGVVSNSWYLGTLDAYVQDSADWDALVRDGAPGPPNPGNQPLVIVFAAGNFGPAGHRITDTGQAKNVLTVGGSENNRPNQPDLVDCPNASLAYFAHSPNHMWRCSSRGPTRDGRLKPDLVGPTAWLASTSSSRRIHTCTPDVQPPIPDPAAGYCWFGGTSGATPQVSGAVAVFIEFYRTAKATTPSPALVKAALINSAVDMPTNGAGTRADEDTGPIPNYDEGWGRANLPGAIDSTLLRHYVDQTTTLSGGQTFSLPIYVSNPSAPLKITLAWTDAPGDLAIGQDPLRGWLRNDLDLRVTYTGPTSSVMYYGNAFFLPGVAPSQGFSTPIRSASTASQNSNADWDTDGDGFDNRNNLENVFVSVPSPGTYRIEVIGRWVPVGPQDFALVVSGTGFVVDDAPPDPPVLSLNTAHSGPAAPSWTVHDSPLFEWSPVSDRATPPWTASGVSRYEGLLDEGLPGQRTVDLGLPCTSNLCRYHPTLFEGPHTLKVRAIDKAGNPSGWSNAVGINIDNDVPVVQTFYITGRGSTAVNPSIVTSTNVDLVVQTTDLTGTVGIRFTNALPSWQEVAKVIESPHNPYPNDYDKTWAITHAGADRIRVHFSLIDTEPASLPDIDGCFEQDDWMYVYDQAGYPTTPINVLNGYLLDTWSSEVLGDTIYVRFVTDCGDNDYYGFRIDKYAHWKNTWVDFAYGSPTGEKRFQWTLAGGPEGVRTVYMEAWDGRLHTASSSDQVTYDAAGPVTTLDSPPDGYATTSQSVTLSWHAVDTGSGLSGRHQIQIDDQIDAQGNLPSPFYDAILSQTQFITCSGSPPVACLPVNQVSWWRVRAEDSAGNWGDWAAAWRTIVDQQSPSQPNPPKDEGAWSDAKVMWTWDPVVDLSGVQYEVQVLESGVQVALVLTNDAFYEYPSGREGFVYTAKVRAIDRAGNPPSPFSLESDGIRVDVTGPNQPGPPFVDPGDETDGIYYVKWNPVSDRPTPGSGVSAYTLQESTDLLNWLTLTGRDLDAASVCDPTLCQYLVSGRISNTYYYRVAAVDLVGNAGGFSNPSAGITVPGDTQAPTAVQLLINNGAYLTPVRNVMLMNVATDPPPSSGMLMCHRNEVDAPSLCDRLSPNWVPFAPEREWTLSPGAGLKTVYFYVKDNAGNFDPVRGVTFDTILYRPCLWPCEKALSGVENSQTVTVTITFSGTSGSRMDAKVKAFEYHDGKLKDVNETALVVPPGGGMGLSVGFESADGGSGTDVKTIQFTWRTIWNGSLEIRAGYSIRLDYSAVSSLASNPYNIQLSANGRTSWVNGSFAGANGNKQYDLLDLSDELEQLFASLFHDQVLVREALVGEQILKAPGDPVGNSTNNWASFFWDFGDGTNSTQQNVSHNYSAPGIYVVRLTVTYDWYNTKTVLMVVRVQ